MKGQVEVGRKLAQTQEQGWIGVSATQVQAGVQAERRSIQAQAQIQARAETVQVPKQVKQVCNVPKLKLEN